jgi:acyl-CoA thioesterase I
VVNGGVNGDTSAGLLARLPSLLARHRPDLVILCIGGNDLLRRQSIEALRANLERAVDLSRQAGAEVLLMAVPVPFTQQDHPVYRRVAEAKGVALVSGVASRLQASDFQFDGVHPNGAGYARITDAVAEVLG